MTPHDVRDQDFQLPPILGSIGKTPAVFGAGKRGLVIAWNADTHKRIWQASVGVHRNDTGPLPTHRVLVCPGLLGGVLTPMAYAQNTLFVPVVDLCMHGSAYGYESLGGVNVTKRGKGEFIALDATTGKRLWTRKLPQPDFSCATVARGVVFTATYDGTVYGFDTATGATLWQTRMPAGINSCPRSPATRCSSGRACRRRTASASSRRSGPRIGPSDQAPTLWAMEKPLRFEIAPDSDGGCQVRLADGGNPEPSTGRRPTATSVLPGARSCSRRATSDPRRCSTISRRCGACSACRARPSERPPRYQSIRPAWWKPACWSLEISIVCSQCADASLERSHRRLPLWGRRRLRRRRQNPSPGGYSRSLACRTPFRKHRL